MNCVLYCLHFIAGELHVGEIQNIFFPLLLIVKPSSRTSLPLHKCAALAVVAGSVFF